MSLSDQKLFNKLNITLWNFPCAALEHPYERVHMFTKEQSLIDCHSLACECSLIDLSSKSTWNLVWSWLFFGGLNKEHSISVHLCQTHFSMSRGAKMSLALINRNSFLFIQIQTLPTSMHHQKWKEMINIVFTTANGRNIRGELWTKRPIELKDSSNM